MTINRTINSLLKEKSKIIVEGDLHGNIIFSFDRKIICKIGKHLKDFYNQEDKFVIAFYYETIQPFHSDEEIYRIVMSGKGEYFSTDKENDSYDAELDTALCHKLFSFLIVKMYDVENILDILLEKYENKAELKIPNAKPLFLVLEMTTHPSEIYNINRDGRIIYYCFREYMWGIIPRTTTHYSLRLFLNKEYQYNDFKSDVGSIAYIDPHYIDFDSKMFSQGNVKFFDELYNSLICRIMSAEDIFKTINK